MALGKIFKSLFSGKQGGEQAVSADPIDYNGFTIEAAPMPADGQFRTAGFISGEKDGEVVRIPFIRADQNSDRQAAIDHSIAKARQIIDEQGDTLLDRTQL